MNEGDAFVEKGALVQRSNDVWHHFKTMIMWDDVAGVMCIVLTHLYVCKKNFMLLTGVAVLLEKEMVDAFVEISM